MKERTTRSLLRSVALVGAVAAGATAFGDYVYEWNAGQTEAYWTDTTKWNMTDTSTNPWTVVDSVPEGAVFTERRILHDATIKFGSLVAGDTASVLVANGTNTFAADAAEEGSVNGLSNPTASLWVSAPWWYTGNTVLQLTSGVYTFNNVGINVDGTNGGTATLTLNGGTLSTASVTGTGTLAVGANGGTFAYDSTDQDATISVAITGAGTLTKTGAGTLNITGDTSAFSGALVVEGTGKILVGDDANALVITVDNSPYVLNPMAKALDLDFEDASTYTSGWTLDGNGGYSQSERTLADGSTSNFLRVWTGTGSGDRQYTASYTLPSEITSATEYTLEFDWFAAQNAIYGDTTLDMGLYVYADSDVKLKIISNPVTLSGNKAQIYLDGSETPLETTIDTAPAQIYSTDASPDCTGTTNQDKWYHIVFRANATDGLTLTILDYQGNTALAETKVSDFANITRLYLDLNKRRSNFEAFSGFDNVVGTVPAVVAIGETGYATLAAAAKAAVSGNVIKLVDNVVLTESVVLPLGVTVSLNGNTLTTTDSAVEVTYVDGVHKLASTTQDDTKYFGETIVAGEGSFIWTGRARPNEDGSYNWSDVDNWEGGAAPTSATDAVLIGTGDAITIVGDSAMTGVLYIERDVTITGSWTLATVDGTGTLKMDGVTLTGTGDFTVNCDLDTANSVYVASGSLVLYGALTGTGTITHYSNSSGSPSYGFQFHGDTSAFAGSYTGCTRASNSRDRTKFYSPAFGSANAYWQFGFEGSSGGDKSHAFQSSGEYHFGTLDSQALKVLDATGVTLVIGERAGTSTLVVDGGLRNATNKIVKKNPAEGSSTLDLTLTAVSDGAVEAEAGVLNLNGENPPTSLTITGTDATVVVASTCGTTTTETVVVTEAVVDDPATEEDETQAAVTQEVSTFTPYKPVLSADLAAAYYQLKSVAGESATTYTVADVAQDADGNTYKTIAAALAAIADAEDKTITVIFDTNEPVVLPAVGYKLDTDGYTTGTVSGATGVGVTVADGVYTTVDNTSATWKGDAAGANWADADNWSTGAVPDESTAVKFTYNALVYISDHNNLAHKCASMDIADGVTVEFAPPEKNYTIFPRVAVYGGIYGGKGTLKLWRSGIIEQADGYVDVYPAVTFENPGVADGQTRDSWFQGNYTFRGDVTGTGVLVIYNACTFNNANINVPEGSVVDFRENPTFSHASETLTGAGTVIVHYVPANGSRWKSALQNSTNWQGVTEVQGTYTNIDAANFGGSGSTVRFNGASGYMRYSDGSTVEVGNVKTIDIGANGLTLNNKFSSGTGKNYIISAALTGSGTIAFGTQHMETNKAKYIFTGDVSGFTGAINYGSLGSYRACVYFASGVTSSDVDSDSLTAPTDWGQIIVEDGNTVNVGSTWTAPGGFVINGEATIANVNPFSGTVNGAGKLLAKTLPTTNITFGEGWTGEFVIKAGGPWRIPAYGNTVVVGSDVSGYFTNGNGNGPATSGAAIRLDANVTINNGWASTTAWPANTTKITGISGTGNLAFTWTTATANAETYYEIVSVGDYSGTISVGSKSNVKIGTINLAAAPSAGDCLVKLGAGSSSKVLLTDTAVTVNGEEFTLAQDLVATDTGIYYGQPSEGLDPTSDDPSYASDATTEEDAVTAAKAAVVAPSGAAENYAECFKYTVTGSTGAYVVTITGIAEDVVTAADTSALAILNGDEGATAVTVPAGLYYKVSTFTTLGGTAETTASGVSTGSVTVTKPGTAQGFIEIKIGAKAADVE